MTKRFIQGTVLGSIVAAVVLVAASAWAGTGVGAIFNLGKTNSVNSTSALIGKTSAKELQITNTGSGPALGLGVGSGKAPLTVNSNAGTATNLSADKLDGKDSSAFQQVSRIFSQITSVNNPVVKTIGPWHFNFDCEASSAAFVVHGPGTVATTTVFAAGGNPAQSFVGAQVTAEGFDGVVGTDHQMHQDMFLKSGTSAAHVEVTFDATNGGLFENCEIIGNATLI